MPAKRYLPVVRSFLCRLISLQLSIRANRVTLFRSAMVGDTGGSAQFLPVFQITSFVFVLFLFLGPWLLSVVVETFLRIVSSYLRAFLAIILQPLGRKPTWRDEDGSSICWPPKRPDLAALNGIVRSLQTRYYHWRYIVETQAVNTTLFPLLLGNCTTSKSMVAGWSNACKNVSKVQHSTSK